MKTEYALPSVRYVRQSGRRNPNAIRRHLPAAIADLFPLTTHPRKLPNKLVAEYFSPKCGEFVLAESLLERDALLGFFEFNARMIFYVPHPLKVDTRFGKRKVSTVFDVASWDGSPPVVLWEIKPDSEIHSKRVATRQLPTQEAFCVEHGYGYRLLPESEVRARPQALRNYAEMLGYLARRRQIDLSDLERDIGAAVAYTALTIRQVLSKYWQVPDEWVRTAIYRLIHAGSIRADLATAPLTDDLVIGGAQ